MTISSIAQQPAADSYVAAYRPCIIQAVVTSLTSLEQPLFCDVYFYNSSTSAYEFFKTLTTYYDPVPNSASASSYNFTFDIQQTLQDFLRKNVVSYPLSGIQQISLMTTNNYFSATGGIKCKCYLRTSSIDSDGAIQPQTPIPVGGDALNQPTSTRTGSATNAFFVFNSSLRPLDNTTIETQLHNNTTITDNDYFSYGAVKADSLMNRPRNDEVSYSAFAFAGILTCDFNNVVKLGKNDYASETFMLHYPAISSPQFRLGIFYYENPTYAHTEFYYPGGWISLSPDGIYTVPVGPKELAAIFPGVHSGSTWTYDGFYRITSGAATAFNESNVYRVIVETNGVTGSGTIIWASNAYQVDYNATADRVPLHFLNSLGFYETFTFERSAEEHTVTSDLIYTNPANANFAYMNNSRDTGYKRYNVRGEDVITLYAVVNAEFLQWLKELIKSPYILMQENDPNHAYTSNARSYTPVVIEDMTFTTRALQDRFNYELAIKVRRHMKYKGVRI